MICYSFQRPTTWSVSTTASNRQCPYTTCPLLLRILQCPRYELSSENWREGQVDWPLRRYLGQLLDKIELVPISAAVVFCVWPLHKSQCRTRITTKHRPFDRAFSVLCGIDTWSGFGENTQLDCFWTKVGTPHRLGSHSGNMADLNVGDILRTHCMAPT